MAAALVVVALAMAALRSLRRTPIARMTTCFVTDDRSLMTRSRSWPLPRLPRLPRLPWLWLLVVVMVMDRIRDLGGSKK